MNKIFILLSLPLFILTACNNSNSVTQKPSMESVSFLDTLVNYDGQYHTITAENYPVGSSITYANEGPFKNAGAYPITVCIKHPDYRDFIKTSILTINPVDMQNVKFENKTIVYNGNTHTLAAEDYPAGSKVEYINNGPFKDVGTYDITVQITHQNYNTYTKTANLTIQKGTMLNVNFSNQTIDYDGEYHTIEASGYPEGSTVIYSNKGPFKDVGVYQITVNITNPNYDVYSSTATLTIKSVTPRTGIGGIEEYDDSNWKTSDLKQLECGSYQMPLPKNYKTPFVLKTTLSEDASSWSNNSVFDLDDLKAANFRYIYKNSCDDGPTYHKNNGDFYAPSAGGGVQLSREGEGFQSSMFSHAGAKMEFRFVVSKVANASGTPEKNKDMAHLYLFNKYGKLLDTYKMPTDSINTSSTQLKFYYTSEQCINIAYFEFRLITKPYKSSQCYNFGISECNFKSWERV